MKHTHSAVKFLICLILAAVWSLSQPFDGPRTADAAAGPSGSDSWSIQTDAGDEAFLRGAFSRRLVALGYSVIGPIRVRSFDPKSLGLYTGHKVYMIDLQGKLLIVRDIKARRITSGRLQSNSMVKVAWKADKVLVYVLKEGD